MRVTYFSIRRKLTKPFKNVSPFACLQFYWKNIDHYSGQNANVQCENVKIWKCENEQNYLIWLSNLPIIHAELFFCFFRKCTVVSFTLTSEALMAKLEEFKQFFAFDNVNRIFSRCFAGSLKFYDFYFFSVLSRLRTFNLIFIMKNSRQSLLCISFPLECNELWMYECGTQNKWTANTSLDVND